MVFCLVSCFAVGATQNAKQTKTQLARSSTLHARDENNNNNCKRISSAMSQRSKVTF
jgi:hypothetical protein